MKRYEQISHTADLAAIIYGKDFPELFENAAFAMFDMIADLEGLGSEESVDIHVEAPDSESLLVSWLNEVLYVSFIKRILFNKFSIQSLEDKNLTAVACGEKFKENTNRLKTEIKAATYHDLKIKKTDKGYEVTVIFDV